MTERDPAVGRGPAVFFVGYDCAYTARRHARDSAEHTAILRCEEFEGTRDDLETVARVLDRGGASDLAELVRRQLTP